MNNPKSFYKLLIVLIALVVAGVSAASYPVFSKLNSLSKKISEKEIILANFTQKELTLKTLEKSYNNIKKEADKFFSALPQEKNSAELMAALENLARTKGVEISVYQHKEPVKKKTQAKDTVETEKKSDTAKKTETATSVDQSLLQTEKKDEVYRLVTIITLTGSYEKIQAYIKEFEKLNRLLVTDKITITKEKEDGAPRDFAKAIIEFSIYLKR